MAVRSKDGRRRGKREEGEEFLSKHHIDNSDGVWRMSGMMPDGTAEPVSRDRILRRERGQGKYMFPSSADHNKQDSRSYRLMPSLRDDHTYRYRPRYLLYRTCPLHTNSGCGKRESPPVVQLVTSKPSDVGT